MAEQCCAVPMPRHAVLCPRCAGPCYAIAVRTHATPSLCVASPLQSRAMLRPCASVLGRSVARRSHALEASPLPCAALPCHGCATRISAHAERVRADQRHRHESQTRAVPPRCEALPLPRRPLLCHCFAVLGFADAWPCWALPSRRAAPPGGALPLRRRERLSRCARCAALCRRLAGCRGALPLRSVSLLCRCAARRC